MTLNSDPPLLNKAYNLLEFCRTVRNRDFTHLSLVQRLALEWPILGMGPFLQPPDIPFRDRQEELIETEARLHEIERQIRARGADDEKDSLLLTYVEKVKHVSMSLREQYALLQAKHLGDDEYHFDSHPYITEGGLRYKSDTSHAHLRKLRSTYWAIMNKCIQAGRQLNDAMENPPDYFRNEYGLSDEFKEELGM